jgi:alpha-ketoglutarate-dependent taurine dioxygenase
MGIKIQPCDSSLGAVVTGIDLNSLDDQGWLAVEEVWHEHAVLIFPRQHISEEQHVALGQRIGPIEILAENRKAVVISNQKPDGELLGPDSGYYQILRAMKAGIRTVPICRFLLGLQFLQHKFCQMQGERLSGLICVPLINRYRVRCVTAFLT